MNVCEHYLTKTYLKVSRARYCRCIGMALNITERVLPGFKEILWLFGRVKWEGGII